MMKLLYMVVRWLFFGCFATAALLLSGCSSSSDVADGLDAELVRVCQEVGVKDSVKVDYRTLTDIVGRWDEGFVRCAWDAHGTLTEATTSYFFAGREVDQTIELLLRAQSWDNENETGFPSDVSGKEVLVDRINQEAFEIRPLGDFAIGDVGVPESS